ncbi:MAG TPA: L,D-transpeptidase [Anaerolineales bacterium]|nr:L,D-transpeptidase [Anaerolineales bacterium]
MKNYSRRDFLKIGGLALASLAFTPFLPELTEFDDAELVRVAKDPVSVYSQPSDKSTIVHTWVRDNLIHVYESVQAPTSGNTTLWYRVFGGYMNAGRLQQVKIQYNVPLSVLPSPKVLSEVTVPYSDAFRYNQWDGWTQYYRLYYSSIQWITGIDSGPDGKAWYVVQDEADKNLHYYVPAQHLRPISPAELSPISADVPLGQKRIDVNLTTQTLTCFEGDKQVFTTKVSTGQGVLLATPAGDFNIMVKLPSRNMSTTSPLADDVIPLVGVPWCSFFTPKGHAFHGTYWHNNFGFTMSHGCVNMRNEDALWLFRWNQPTAGFDNISKTTLDVKGYGTAAHVHY